MEKTSTTVIIALWYHRLNLRGYKKSIKFRLIAAGPVDCLIDEQSVDTFYQIDRDENCQPYDALIEKVRELVANSNSTQRYICVFEKNLQHAIAKIRFDLDVQGITPGQVQLFLNSRDLKTVVKRSGLTIPRSCILSLQPELEQWCTQLRTQIGRFPIFLKPLTDDEKLKTSMRRLFKSFDLLKEWITQQHGHITDFSIEEGFHEGNEFTAIASKLGLVGILITTNCDQSVLESVQKQVPYALEYLSAEKTRNLYPGIEYFVLKATKSVFNKSAYSLVFISGFYRGHSDIYFMNAALEPSSKTHSSLIYAANYFCWETMLLENLISHIQNNDASVSHDNEPNSYRAVINFPTSEGTLLHQTVIPKQNAELRVIWKASEGEALRDALDIDDNVLQVYVRHENRNLFLNVIEQIMNETNITIDRSCPIENICCKNRYETRNMHM